MTSTQHFIARKKFSMFAVRRLAIKRCRSSQSIDRRAAEPVRATLAVVHICVIRANSDKLNATTAGRKNTLNGCVAHSRRISERSKRQKTISALISIYSPWMELPSIFCKKFSSTTGEADNSHWTPRVVLLLSYQGKNYCTIPGIQRHLHSTLDDKATGSIGTFPASSWTILDACSIGGRKHILADTSHHLRRTSSSGTRCSSSSQDQVSSQR